MQRSGRGAAVTPCNPKVARALALFHLPEATMRCLSVSLASHLAIEMTSMFGSHGFEGVGLGPFRLRPGMTVQQMKADLFEVERSCERATQSEAALIVARLLVRTKMRAHGEGEAALLAETLVDDLRQYPADVVEFACEYWCDGGADNKFTPSWPELKEICDRRMDGRLRLRKALEWHIENYSPAT